MNTDTDIYKTMLSLVQSLGEEGHKFHSGTMSPAGEAETPYCVIYAQGPCAVKMIEAYHETKLKDLVK